jgi:hypothetical protein
MGNSNPYRDGEQQVHIHPNPCSPKALLTISDIPEKVRNGTASWVGVYKKDDYDDNYGLFWTYINLNSSLVLEISLEVSKLN